MYVSRFVIPSVFSVLLALIALLLHQFCRLHSEASISSSVVLDSNEKISNERLYLELKEIQRQQLYDRYFFLGIIFIAFTILIIIILAPHAKEKWITGILNWMQKLQKYVPAVTENEPKNLKKTSQTRLENSLCVVGFEEGETQRHHVEMAKDLVGPDKRLQMKSVVVTSPDSLVNIPPSKILLMFVDYNERNLIIEEAEDGIRRRTLDVLIKSGAEVIVVYCWELSSKNLEEGYLYAPKLGSVSKVPRLIELSRKNSVYSIYKQFKQHQKSAYQRKLKELQEFIK
ncbi:uncharacterized protein LOC128192515 isoform X1 [Crassostrea angulata]|uniref:uncharacterized protein LOC128192515 isoform X1 n=1 Tax=Magallana angulata TaxID=2784310 RepID=UPI0022B12733|nr:uncharacterized protein LOC128192515 isoform X1 [Crassostrea angulata]